MNVLVVGSGGREHALMWKLSKNPRVSLICCAPGNAGTAEIGYNIDISPDDIDGLIEFAKGHEIGLTVVGPEAPLTKGIADKFIENGLRVFGPTQKAAELEGSKIFSKNLMAKYGIPTGGYVEFDDSKEAMRYLRRIGAPIVVKADGLAAGKGVVVAYDLKTAEQAVNMMMEDRLFGEAGARVLLEELLEGPEVSMLSFTDGRTVLPMASAQDHKRAYDGDKGPNTGGMGAFSPSPLYTQEISQVVEEQILKKTVEAMNTEGRHYSGVLYAGLMLTRTGPKVLEFNCRFGDPETQAVLPRLKTDLVDVMLAVIEGRLSEITLEWSEMAAVCVVAASGGYPGKYETGKPITGLQDAANVSDAFIFHAGTREEQGDIFTAGGRVLGVTALGENLNSAAKRAYSTLELIKFDKMHYRRDISVKS